MDIHTMGLIIAYTLCMLLSLLFSFILVDKIFKAKLSHASSILILFICSIVLALGIHFVRNLPALYTFAFIGGVLMYMIIFKFNMYQAYFCSCFMVFHMIALKGIVVGSMSLILKENSFMILQDETLLMISVISSQILNAIMMGCYLKIVKIKEARAFLLNKKQMIFTLICHMTIAVFMLFNSFSFYYNLDLIWISIAQIMVGILLYLVYIIILSYGIKTSDMMQHKLRDQNQLEMIQAQMRQQNSLLKMTEILNAFKHEYREHMLTIESHIENGYYDLALIEMKKDCLHHFSQLPHSIKYSNNIIINSLMIDRRNICDTNHIKMEAVLFYPLDLSITEKEYHEVVRILSENAIDANMKVAKDKRYMKIKSNINEEWLSVLIENPYDGLIYFENGIPVSMNEHNDNSGMGLIYITELMEEHKGIIHFDVDSENLVFKVSLLIHIDATKEAIDI